MNSLTKIYKTLSRNNLPIIIKKSNGSKLYDIFGNSYIDATSSYCSANFGHNNPIFKHKLMKQIDELSVCPRYLENNNLNKLATTVNKYFIDKINLKKNQYLQIIPSLNGVDAFETALKVSRAWAHEIKKIKIGESKQIYMDKCFHGRTLAAISMNNNLYQTKFYPKVNNFISCHYNNIEYLQNILENNSTISAIFVEPVQAEGGIIVPHYDYLFRIRKLCDQYNVLMICDEIQTGLFRTGNLLCLEKSNIKADIVLLGKSLGGGFLPISLCIGSNEVMSCIKEGEHGSTFGGNPLASNMANEVLEYVNNNNFKNDINDLSHIYKRNLYQLKEKYKFIKEIRSSGMLFGIELDDKIMIDNVCNSLTEYNILTKNASNNTIRLSPPFIITNYETEELFDGFDKCFNKI